ncbi:pyridoxal phosphate-dependent decarboxylase family protein [Cryptosporangium aurantiacum]|uniref:Glutamate or tyrosine decarboxylase n=1 Tax=Cryptosporangium aurantiacum TaxID=134849 RepID=A0A1M7QNK8_9ACTN|nr:aminotransferase class V-fold PLP-dependent enzyme [Cryptosporangium aurantiacum]SHN33079.1 Glutamate or tyrosine decarboxylase [Cryptosporangium aurantiacum]
MTLEKQGAPAEDVLAELAALRAADLPTHGGRTWAYVYDSGLAGLDALAHRAAEAVTGLNGLDPTVFPSLLTMENEVVAAAARLLGGGPGTVGTVTSGGTESILLAVKAARDGRHDVERPQLVAPVTAHAAFAKAAEYFRVELVPVEVDPVTFRPDPADVAAAITDRTVLVVASAPSYAHGVIDPVVEIAAVAAERGVRCHVDACIGGWVLPFWRRLGVPMPGFDLSVPGVTSLSVDLHKYAYAPKGTSVLLHRDAELRRSQYFAFADWPGYSMINATMQSTKSAAPLAAAWAVLRHLGEEGYLALAEQTLAATRTLIAGVEAVEGLRVLGPPQASLVAFGAADDGPDLFVLADELTVRGWYVQPQFALGALPTNLHLTVTAASAPKIEPFLADLRDAVAAAHAHGPVAVDAGIVEWLRTLDPSTLTSEEFGGLLAAGGLAPGDGGGAFALPARMAEINALLAAAPPRLRERLLIEFFGLLYTP